MSKGKRLVLTTIGIILSLVIAVGGWVLTSHLMDMESERLLSGITSFAVDTPLIEFTHFSNYDDDYPYARPRLTEDEIVSVLRNWEQLPSWEHTVRRRLHEPAAGQINMQQAIEIAREGLLFLLDYGILPQEALTFNDVRAYLGQNILPSDDFLPIEYSYWNVRFFNDYMDVLMTINAVTGQIWRKEIEIDVIQTRIPVFAVPIAIYTTSDGIKNALAAFMSEMGLYFNDDTLYGILAETQNTDLVVDRLLPPTRPVEGGVYMSFSGYQHLISLASHRFADGNGAARVIATGMLTEEGILHFSRFNIFLTTWVA